MESETDGEWERVGKSDRRAESEGEYTRGE